MGKQKGRIFKWGLGMLVAVILAVALLPPPALAIDNDADGIPDELESAGGREVSLPPGAAVWRKPGLCSPVSIPGSSGWRPGRLPSP